MLASCEGRDLNPRPPAYETGELPNCSTPLEPPIRIERMTDRLQGDCSTTELRGRSHCLWP